MGQSTHGIIMEAKFLETTHRRHLSASMIVTVNGYYGNDVNNVKDVKHQKSSAAYAGGHTQNVFTAKERHFSGKKEFNNFLQNSENKICLLALLKSYLHLDTNK